MKTSSAKFYLNGNEVWYSGEISKEHHKELEKILGRPVTIVGSDGRLEVSMENERCVSKLLEDLECHLRDMLEVEYDEDGTVNYVFRRVDIKDYLWMIVQIKGLCIKKVLDES